MTRDPNPRRKKLGDTAAVLRYLVSGAPADGRPSRDDKRRILAEYCKMTIPPKPVMPGEELGGQKRVRATLHRLLAGDSEKQIAIHLKISAHTVHVYVKRLYKHYDVSSRGELLARFVAS